MLYKKYQSSQFLHSYSLILFQRFLLTHMSTDSAYIKAFILNSRKRCNITLLYID